jgi:hypothetical protein
MPDFKEFGRLRGGRKGTPERELHNIIDEFSHSEIIMLRLHHETDILKAYAHAVGNPKIQAHEVPGMQKVLGKGNGQIEIHFIDGKIVLATIPTKI